MTNISPKRILIKAYTFSGFHGSGCSECGLLDCDSYTSYSTGLKPQDRKLRI
jgi:hypothetical protein